MKKYFDDILKSDATVSEKLDMISKRVQAIKDEASLVEDEILKDVEYCNECKEYYKKTAYDVKIKSEITNVCTFWPLAEFDDPTYEDKLCRIEYKTCPCGHIKTKNLDYSRRY